MNKHILSAVFALLLIFTLKAEDTLFCTGETNAEFSVKATMHSFTGTTGDIEFSAAGVVDTSIGDTSISMDIGVPVKNMKTGKEKRDRNMYSMFESEKHPYITVTVKSVSIDAARPGPESPGRIPFYLKIRDIKNTQSAEVTNWKEKNNKIIFTASFKVSLKSYSLAPPSALLGVITVDDVVKIDAEVVLSKKNP